MSRLLNEKEIETIRRYFDFDLSEKELELFEQQLESDADFAKGVEHYESAYQTIDDLVIGNHDTPVISIQTKKKEEQISSKVVKRSPFKLFLAAASLVGVICIACFFILGNDTIDERVFAEADQYTRMMSDDVLRGDNDSIDISTSEELQLKKIISEYEKENPLLTTQALTDYLKNVKNPTNQELGEWWLANIFLQSNDLEQAKEVLTKIKNNPNYNSSKKAASFLDKL